MTTDLLAWTDGTLRPITDTDWAEIAASFLGAGFRIDLPPGARGEAVIHERARVERLAHLLGESLPQAAWEVAVQTHPDLPVEVLGGWPRSATGDAPGCVAVRVVQERLGRGTAVVLADVVAPGPTRGLPTISRLADEVALAGVDAGVGIWADSEGGVVTSTAGPVLAQRGDGSWAMGSDSATWLAGTIVAERGATRGLRVDDLRSAQLLGVIRRAVGVQAIRLMPA